MVTATKISIDSTKKSTDGSSKMYRSNLSSQSTSEVYKLDNINSKSTSKAETSRREDFKDVLTSKTKSRDEDIKEEPKAEVKDEVKDTNKVDELKEKLKELEDDSKSDSKDEVNNILTELLNLLTKLGIKEEDLKSNGEINSDILKTMIEGITGDKTSKSDSSSAMDKLMELLKNNSEKGNLDTDSLKSIEKILNNFSAKLTDDNIDATKNIKSGIKNLISEISTMIDNNENQSGKVLTLEDMLNKNYSQENKDSKEPNSEVTKNNKEVSKEDKFLNSLIDDDKDSSLNKINLFATRTQTIQNQGVDTVRGLSINKATFTDDLIKDVKFMSNNGLKELIVKVNPGNLGEITIKLVQEDGLMKANLKANSKETSELLSQNLTDIKKQLGEQNIKITDVNIELYQDDTTFFKEQGSGRQLSEEQGRSKNSNSSTGNELKINEEDLIDNIATNDNNVDSFV
jgi:flagellar hook-length control protein FliK